MHSKSLLIAIAAFAVTATGVHAYGGPKVLNRAGLNDEQVEAIEVARGLRQAGDLMAARNKLVEAGITEETLRSVHMARLEAKTAIHEALEKGNYEAFKEAIVDSPLADIITTKEDFEQFKQAHALKLKGEWKESRLIMDELGFTEKGGMWNGKQHFPLENLTTEQYEALMVAKQGNDRATIQAILDEAGVESRPHRYMMRW